MKLSIPKYYVNYFVAVMYLLLGILILLKYSVGQDKPDVWLSLFGVVVIVYGIFRGHRAYREYESEKEDQDEME